MKDRIHLLGVTLSCRIGVTAEERAAPQPIVVDVWVETSVSEAARADDVAKTVDYGRILDALMELAGAREYALVETLAEAMAATILRDFEVESVHLLLKKPHALRHRGVEAAAVEIERQRHV